MPTEAKRETVAELREALSSSRTLIVSEYRGLTVKEIAEIRRALRKQDVSYRVVKNRLLRIAAQDTLGEALSPLLTGPTAIAFGNDESTTAKAVIDATRAYKIVTIKGAVLGDRAISADAVPEPGQPAAARGPPREARRWHAGPDRNARRPSRREHPQPGLCACPGSRPESPVRRRVAPRRIQRRTTPMAVMTQDDLLEAIDKMTVLELSEFIKRFEERYGVTAAAPVAAAAAPAAGGGAGAEAPAEAAEQTEFTATLTEIGPNKIPVIKVVRELTGLGLKEAKDLVDATPKAVKEGVTRDEADKIKAAIEEVRAARSKSSSSGTPNCLLAAQAVRGEGGAEHASAHTSRCVSEWRRRQRPHRAASAATVERALAGWPAPV